MIVFRYAALAGWAALCLAVLSLAGCSSGKAKYPKFLLQDDAKALLVIYRPAPPITMPAQYVERPPEIYHGGQKLIALRPGAYTQLELEPGFATFSARIRISGELQGRVNVDLQAGRYYFLRYLDFDYRGLLPAGPHEFRIVPAELAREELRDARYQVPID